MTKKSGSSDMGDILARRAPALATAAELVDDVTTSERWDGTRPVISVVVATFRRSDCLHPLFEALEKQHLEAGDFEVIVVDDGSGDDTWSVLRGLAASTSLAAKVARSSKNLGPSNARNAGIALARSPLVAFTDDDCVPQHGWLAAIYAPLAGGGRIVQGRTLPDPAPVRRPWDHTIRVEGVSGFFETCNIGFHRDDLITVGGFQPLHIARPHSGPVLPGGEDALLGWSVARATGTPATYAPTAVVHHRIERKTFGDWLRYRSRSAVFPALVANVPEFRERLFLGCFLSRRTAAFDVGVVGVVAALLRREVRPLALALPYLVLRLPTRSPRRIVPAARRVPKLAIGDAVTAWSLLRGSFRHRRVVL